MKKPKSKVRNTRKKRRKELRRGSFKLSQTRIPMLAPWIAEGMPDDARAPARWRTCPATNHRTQVSVLHLNEAYARFTTPRDEDELRFALAKTQHQLGNHAVTFHYSAACTAWGAVMFTADQPALVAATIERFWGDALRQHHRLGEPFSRELRWSLPSAPAEMEVLLGLTFVNRRPAVEQVA